MRYRDTIFTRFTGVSNVLITLLAVGSLALPLSAMSAEWTASWKTDPAGFTGAIPPGVQTLREIISPRRAGDVVRLRLTNRDGLQDVTLSAVWIGTQADSAELLPGSNRQLSFGGLSEVIIPAGEEILSDALAFPVTPFTKLAISMQAGGTSGFPLLATSHPVSRELNYFTFSGNAASEAGSGFLPFTLTQGVTFQASWHFIAGLDVETSRDGLRTVVGFGDSITDGLTVNPLVGSTFVEDLSTLGRDERYVDYLQRRFSVTPGYEEFAVVNAGIAGNRLTAGPFAPFFGPAGLDRLQSDVIDVPGVTDVIVHMGINDIAFDIPAQTVGSSAIVTTIIEGLEEVIERLHAEDIRVILGTVMPALGANASAAAPILDTVGGIIGITPGPLHGSGMTESLRQEVNAWILGPGAALADGVVDFDACTRDGTDPRVLEPSFNSGDNLHPNAVGYAAMADCFDFATAFPISAPVGGSSGLTGGSVNLVTGGGAIGIGWLSLLMAGLWLRRHRLRQPRRGLSRGPVIQLISMKEQP